MKEQALKVIEMLKANGYTGVIAGGAVRDMLLGITPQDYDVATDCLPEQVETLFPKTISVGKSFGVIVVVMDGYEIEVATFRQDGNYSDSRRPDSVTFSSIEEDAKRRDITINGMFYDPVEDKIIDYVGGQKDLKNKIIRMIGDPDKRIEEDKLRLLRVVRFSTKLDFSIDLDTFKAVKTHAHEITVVSAERIAEELIKILRTSNPRKAINLLFNTGLIDYILPEVKIMEGCEQPRDFHLEGDVKEHTILALEHLDRLSKEMNIVISDELRMSTLLHDVGKPPTQVFASDRIRFNGHDAVGKGIARKIMERLKFSNDFTTRVVDLVGGHMKFMCVKEMKTSTLKRFMTIPYFEEHMLLHRVDCLSSHGGLEAIEFIEEKLRNFKPEEIRPSRIISGKDLIEMGLVPGELFKTIIENVKERQLEGTILDRDSALEYVKKTYISKAL
jgi:poly(A) polymerase